MTTVSFDVSALGAFPAAHSRRAADRCPARHLAMPGGLPKLIGEAALTVMHAVPSLLAGVHADGGDGLQKIKDVVMLTGGEALPGELAEACVLMAAR